MSRKFYYFNSTHWDREWYQGQQEFRKYLVDVTERLVENFETVPHYDKFTFDGQTIVLEDLAEIRPDLANRLREFIAAGKLNVGPWYVMPDEFLVSGESIIRNLQIGAKVAEEYGAKVWPVGYICDIFGHTAQIPQIMTGFGLEGAVLWRGIDGNAGPYCYWHSPDGTAIKLIHLPPYCGYGVFSMTVLNILDLEIEEEVFKKRFTEYVDTHGKFWDGVPMLLTDALDHSYPTSRLEQIFQWIRELYPDCEIIHDDHRQLLANEFHGPDKHGNVHGELIFPADYDFNFGWQISGTLSSRYDLKSGNDRLQNQLELGLEPMAAASTLNGCKRVNYLVDFAWKSLIKNHPHDSICGCSIASVHRMMKCRYEDIAQINRTAEEELSIRDRERLTGIPFFREVRSVMADDSAEKEVSASGNYIWSFYNPLPFAVKKMRTAKLCFPAALPYPKKRTEPFGYEYMNSFRLRDENGVEIPYAIRSIKRNQTRAFYRQDARKYDEYEVVFATELAPSRWTRIKVEASERSVRYYDTLISGQGTAENAKIRLEVRPDGRFDLTDKRSGRSYRGLNDYSFDREIGDGWNHVKPSGNRRLMATSNAQTVVTCDMPEYAEFEITRSYELPAALVNSATNTELHCGVSESREMRTLRIVTRVGIDSFSDTLSIQTTVSNNIRDYRLQLLLPTGIGGGYFADQHFYCNHRPDGRTWGNAGQDYLEMEAPEKNFAHVIGKRDGRGGIVFSSAGGLHEAGSIDNPEYPLVVTLLRAFSRTIQTNGEDDGQLQQDLDYRYELRCFTPAATTAELLNDNAALRSVTPAYLVKTEGCVLPEDKPVLRLEGEAVFSAFKVAVDGRGVIVRCFNPDVDPVRAKLLLNGRFDVYACSLNEADECLVAENVTEATVALAPYKIGSWRLVKR